MNRPGAAPQTLRGMSGNFGGQQQNQQQPGRPVSNRLPNGKIANNGSGWAFGGGVPMGTAGLPNPAARQVGGGNVSFAQSLSGSGPATPLDMSDDLKTILPKIVRVVSKREANLPSEFPSLSNNPQIPSANQASMWSTAGSRPVQRNQQTSGTPQPPAAQDEMFASGASRMPNGQSSFRFGNQGSILPQQPHVPPSSIDDFPPLNRTANGEPPSDRNSNLMSTLGYAPSNGQGSGTAPPNRGNGLLNALSANSRTSEPRASPGVGAPGKASVMEFRDQTADTKAGLTRPQDVKSPAAGEPKQALQGDAPSKAGAAASGPETRTSGEAIGNSPVEKLKDDKENKAPEVVDPLAGMAEVDKWGIKGLRTLMNNFPDYHAMVVGMDPSSLGIDMNSQDLISTQVYSLFEDIPPRPTVDAGKFRVPECYNVTNVQPIESKIVNFNEETLFWIFYSCPADIKQQLAAEQLHNRNWRWHKKLRIWLTKDEHMTPQILSPNHERGYYIVWDTSSWRKDRVSTATGSRVRKQPKLTEVFQREFTLHYGDLDTTLNQA